MKDKSIAIIPARGGSKRIKDKNIRDFLGKPIIGYVIELALASGLFSEVMVSTDDQKIKDIAKFFGANVPVMRSAENADDHAPLAKVIEEVCTDYRQRGQGFTYACCLLPTAVLAQTEKLELALNTLKDSDKTLVGPIVRFSSPIQRALKVSNDRIEFFHPKHYLSRSQDLEPAFYDAGQFYWFHFTRGFDLSHRGFIELPEIETQDIDTLEDWTLAEMKYKTMHGIK